MRAQYMVKLFGDGNDFRLVFKFRVVRFHVANLFVVIR
jgi:hypothetical protein